MGQHIRKAPLVLLVCAGMALGVTQAWAGTTHYCTGNLNHGWSCADGGVHTGASVFVDVTADHTACAARAANYGGYNSNPTGDDTTVVACTSGSGHNGGSITFGSGAHGAVFNPNSSTTDNIFDAYVQW